MILIKKYMQESDIIISVGRITLYEFCACGTPTLTYAITDNQLDNIRNFLDLQLMNYIGDMRVRQVWRVLSRRTHRNGKKYVVCISIILFLIRLVLMRKLIDELELKEFKANM